MGYNYDTGVFGSVPGMVGNTPQGGRAANAMAAMDVAIGVGVVGLGLGLLGIRGGVLRGALAFGTREASSLSSLDRAAMSLSRRATAPIDAAYRVGANAGRAVFSEAGAAKAVEGANHIFNTGAENLNLLEKITRRTFLNPRGNLAPMDAWFPNLHSVEGVRRFVPNARLMAPIGVVGVGATAAAAFKESTNYQKSPAPTIYYDGTNMRHTKDMGADASYGQSMIGNGSTFELDEATKYRLLSSIF